MSHPFAGIPSFLRAPIVTELAGLDADIAVIGVPTDEGSPFMHGSRFAPRSIGVPGAPRRWPRTGSRLRWYACGWRSC